MCGCFCIMKILHFNLEKHLYLPKTCAIVNDDYKFKLKYERKVNHGVNV